MQLLLQHMQSNQSQPLAATPGRLSLFYLLTCPWPALNLFVFVVPRFLLKIQPVLFPSWGTDGSSVSFLQCERPAPVSYCKAEPALLWLSDLKSFRLSCSVFSWAQSLRLCLAPVGGPESTAPRRRPRRGPDIAQDPARKPRCAPGLRSPPLLLWMEWKLCAPVSKHCIWTVEKLRASPLRCKGSPCNKRERNVSWLKFLNVRRGEVGTALHF